MLADFSNPRVVYIFNADISIFADSQSSLPANNRSMVTTSTELTLRYNVSHEDPDMGDW